MNARTPNILNNSKKNSSTISFGYYLVFILELVLYFNSYEVISVKLCSSGSDVH